MKKLFFGLGAFVALSGLTACGGDKVEYINCTSTYPQFEFSQKIGFIGKTFRSMEIDSDEIKLSLKFDSKERLTSMKYEVDVMGGNMKVDISTITYHEDTTKIKTMKLSYDINGEKAKAEVGFNTFGTLITLKIDGEDATTEQRIAFEAILDQSFDIVEEQETSIAQDYEENKKEGQSFRDYVIETLETGGALTCK